MDYEKSDLDHSEINFYCPACNHSSTAFADDLEKHPQVVCPHCGCIHTVDLDERKNVLDDFWQKVKKIKNGEN